MGLAAGCNHRLFPRPPPAPAPAPTLGSTGGGAEEQAVAKCDHQRPAPTGAAGASWFRRGFASVKVSSCQRRRRMLEEFWKNFSSISRMKEMRSVKENVQTRFSIHFFLLDL